MGKFLDDDSLTDVPAQAKATTKATPPVTKTTPITSAVAVLDDDDSVDLIGDHESLKAQSSLQSVLPKEQGKTVRFALIPGFKAFSKPTHFITTVGKGCTVVCPGEGCPECAKGGEHASRRKIVALALRYETGNDCKLAAGVKPTVTVGFINMSPTAYSTMSECPSEGETLYTIDFKTMKKSNSIGWDFFRFSAPPAYVKIGMEDEVAELATAAYGDGKALKSRLGKIVSAGELKLMIRGGGMVDNAATMDDIEDL